MRKLKLTKKQEERFKELYLQDYSASLIFEELGQPYDNFSKASSRMAYLRDKFGLPKRGCQHKPKHKKHGKMRSKESILKRLNKISYMIQNGRKKILLWQEEARQLQNSLEFQGCMPKLEKEE